MKKIIADIGNSHIKICTVKSDNNFSPVKIELSQISHYNWKSLENGLCYITSVNKSTLCHFLTYAKIYNIKCHIAKREEISKILSYYLDTKKFTSTGIDRLVETQAAVEMFGFDTLSIGCGTALTFSYVDKHGVFKGGTISPGFEMRLEALNEKTGELPKANLNLKPVNILNSKTENAIAAGVYWGITAEIEFITKKISAKNIVLTGGGAGYLFDLITNMDFYYEEFLLLNGALSLAKKEKFL